MTDRSDSDRTGVVVIGGGPGGYVAAIRAAQLGETVTLVDRSGIGGTCLNHGCIPSKALIEASDRVSAVVDAEHMGIYADPYVDGSELVAWKDDVVDSLTDGVAHLCRDAGVDVRTGTAAFVGANEVEISRTDSSTERLAFDNAVVATGSKPIELPGFSFDADPVLDAAQLFSMDRIPDGVVVVGAGYIGMELSTMLAKLGTDVTVVEQLDAVLPRYPAFLTRPVRRRARELSVTFALGQRAAGWRRTTDGIRVSTATDDGTRQTYDCELVLVAVGRRPVTDGLALQGVGLETDGSGFIETDDRCRTAREQVYAVGDVAGEPLLAHEASAAGIVAAETIAGRDASMADRAVPAAVYTDPEIATVGVTSEEADRQGHDPVTGTAPFSASGRAMTCDEPRGLIRIVADGEEGTVLGGHVVGPEASELVAELSLAVQTEVTLAELVRTIHAHPTLGESVLEAAEEALGHPINVPPSGGPDG